MWLITPRGFYSTVAKPEDGDAFVTVRARTESDIRSLQDLIDAVPTEDGSADYRWRLRCRREEWAEAVKVMAEEIDYDNVKDRIYADDPARAKLLSEVWSTLYRLQGES